MLKKHLSPFTVPNESLILTTHFNAEVFSLSIAVFVVSIDSTSFSILDEELIQLRKLFPARLEIDIAAKYLSI